MWLRELTLLGARAGALCDGSTRSEPSTGFSCLPWKSWRKPLEQDSSPAPEGLCCECESSLGQVPSLPLERRPRAVCPIWVTPLSPPQFDGLPLEEEVLEGEGSLEKELAIDNIIGEKIEIIAPVTSPSLDFNDNEDIPTELSDSSDTHDEGGHSKVGVRSCPFSLRLKANRMSLCGGWSPLVSGFLVDGWVRVSLAYGHFLESHCRILLIPYLFISTEWVMCCPAVRSCH